METISTVSVFAKPLTSGIGHSHTTHLSQTKTAFCDNNVNCETKRGATLGPLIQL